MRIVGGIYKGRIFNPGKNFKARPTTDISKEGLFNILENRYDFSDKTVLDLFSGSGSIGYEFISRGCKEAVLVEKDFVHHRFILNVLEILKMENAKIIRADVFSFLRNYKGKFDFIFADPPFDLKNFMDVPDLLLKTELLNNNGLFILEHPKEYDFSKHPNFKENRKYGKVNFTFFEK
ncbi:MAG TPA: 16S rRNA (guanine(966)-N(2))-methyltransferase RsmD [Draconibacterium sp.]|nr:16S rRNA (guanine(966)-N(2))-methyltransferase RsmD [Draconibacterium sp.]